MVLPTAKQTTFKNIKNHAIKWYYEYTMFNTLISIENGEVTKWGFSNVHSCRKPFFAIMCCHTCGIIKIEMAVLHEFPYVGKRQCRKLDSLIRYETLLSRPKTFVEMYIA